MKPILKSYYSFFFSSRRRHTRLQGDWSSDVCSSDLMFCELVPFGSQNIGLRRHEFWALDDLSFDLARRSEERRVGKECRTRGSPGHKKKKKEKPEQKNLQKEKKRTWSDQQEQRQKEE